MRRWVWAWALAALLAGCGGSDRKDQADVVSTVAPATPAAGTVVPSDATRAPAKRKPAAPKATAEPRSRKGRAPRGPRPSKTLPLGGAVLRYVQAINTRRFAALCAGFGRRAGPVCPVRERRSRRRPGRVPAGRGLDQVRVTARPIVTRSGREAQAQVSLVAIDESGRGTPQQELLHLRISHGRWVVAEPSPIFFRAVRRLGSNG